MKKRKKTKNVHHKPRYKNKAHSKKERPKKTERVPTGIPNFDTLIEGGFEKNSTNLLIGGAGSGKSIFAIQFLMKGIKEGEPGLYITFEETKEEFYANMARFGWDLRKYEDEGMFVFLEYTPERVKTMLEEGGGAIENIILKGKIVRVVIDSITSFELLFDNELEKREATFELFNMISKWNCTAVVTFEANIRSSDKPDTRTMEFEADSIIAFYFMRAKNERKRYLEVLKMRGTKHSTKIFSFEMTKTGIALGKKAFTGKIETY
ncbi:MAG: ATPase domain-containing protein [Nanoarchaeota archaeon]